MATSLERRLSALEKKVAPDDPGHVLLLGPDDDYQQKADEHIAMYGGVVKSAVRLVPMKGARHEEP